MFDRAKAHFKKTDPRLHKAAVAMQLPELQVSSDLFRDIVWTIIGQQLSSRAADSIFARFQTLFSRGAITPARILKLGEIEMRTSGLSGAKVRAIQALAEAVGAKRLDVNTLHRLSDQEVTTALTAVKGIGPWTAEMVLMFSLGRPDIFSKGDLGLRKGIMRLYTLKTFPSEKKLLTLTRQWSPYRSYAARVLWKIADEKTQRVGRKRPK